MGQRQQTLARLAVKDLAPRTSGIAKAKPSVQQTLAVPSAAARAALLKLIPQ